jgi:manganese/zinc/iron transport system permease protein
MTRLAFLLLAAALLMPAAARAEDTSFAAGLWRVLTLRDYNTRVVVLGTAMLGVAAGVVGPFLLLRRRALIGDAIAHATLPGVVGVFLVLAAAGHSEARNLPLLLLGAAVSGLLGVGVLALVRRATRLHDDAALGIVLSVFFGLGVAMMDVATRMEGVNAAGLSHFIYGKTASMLRGDALLMAGVAALAAGLALALFKELRLVCFDAAFARAQGWPAGRIDAALLALTVLVTVAGLQAVGLILIVAMLVIPGAAARFWSERLGTIVPASALIGGGSGLAGSALSALVADLPAGAVIVLVAASAFALSMAFGRARGLLWHWLEARRRDRSIARQHVLRALFEAAERTSSPHGVPAAALEARRVWKPGELRRALRAAERDGLVAESSADCWRLTSRGMRAATRVVRNHRLWELFLIEHADIAPACVDRGADRIEHVLDEDMVEELELLLARRDAPPVPASPHPFGGSTAP